MTRFVKQLEILTDFQWAEVNIFNPYLDGSWLIGSYLNDVPIGLATVREDEKNLELVNVFANTEYRHEAFLLCFNELLDAAVSLSEERKLPICFQILLDDRNIEYADKVLKSKDFKRDTDKHFITCLADKATKVRWYDFLEKKGNSMLARLSRKGFINIPYNKLTDVQKDYLQKEAKFEFKREVNTESLRLPLDGENSFFTFLNGELATYCIVFRVTSSQLVFEYIELKEKFKNSGASLMPLISFITNTFNYDITQSIVFIYHDENHEMALLSKHMLSIVINNDKVKAFYYRYCD